ncbi:MAG: secretin N-terminal domain-containing protein [Candidatus Aminicenantaceae bacterium]
MKKAIPLIVIVITLWGCTALNQNYRLGTEAAINKDWDEAVKYYEKAIWENPKNSVYRLALLRSKIFASYYHLLEARKFVAQGMKEEALVEYEKALVYDPLNRVISEEARLLRSGEVREERIEMKEMVPPIRLKAPREKVDLKFNVDTSLSSIFKALGKFAHVNILFDEQFKDISFTIDLMDMTFEEALNALCLASKNFYRVIDEKTLIIAPDQPLKRAQYELNAIRTFYVSNINAQEIQGPLAQMLRSQFRAPSIIVDKNLNSITVRDTPSNIELAEKILRVWDKSKGEVVVDLEIMEVSRIKLRQLGLDFDKSLIMFKHREAEANEASGWINLKDIDFSKSENFEVSLPISFVRFLESDADTRIIAQPRLRGLEGEELKYLVGDKIPIPQTTFTPIAAGGVSQQPIVSYMYQDVGIDIKITPNIHFEKEVTLELEMKITSLGGKGYADIPIISTREVKNVIRLKDGETNLLAGLLKDEERKTLKGIAGLKNIPVLGGLFSNTDETISQTDVVLTITPYIIRTISLDEKDLEPLWIGIEGVAPASRLPGLLPEVERLPRQVRRERDLDVTRQNQIFLNPSNIQIPQDREFRINVNVRSQQEIGNLSLGVSFNVQVVKLKEIIEGSLLRQLGGKVPFLKNIDNSSGLATIGISSPYIARGIKGEGSIATLVFQAVGKGEGAISISSVTAYSSAGGAVAFTTKDCRILVR